jgi:hypothetical protein
MQKIFRYRKYIGLTVSISIFLLNFPLSPARAVMITTEFVNNQDSEQLTDRARVRAFLGRADVLAQIQAYGISHEEALSRVDSLTDREIASLAGNMDQIPEVAGGYYELDGSLLAILGLALYAIFMAIAIYFSRTMEKEEKPQLKKEQYNHQPRQEVSLDHQEEKNL